MGYMMDPTVTIPGPAPKVEEMPIETMNMPDDEFDYEQEIKAERTAERRALARDAYMAALGGLAARGDLSVTDTSEGASVLALETVRRWDAFMAAVDAEGGE